MTAPSRPSEYPLGTIFIDPASSDDANPSYERWMKVEFGFAPIRTISFPGAWFLTNAQADQMLAGWPTQTISEWQNGDTA